MRGSTEVKPLRLFAISGFSSLDAISCVQAKKSQDVTSNEYVTDADSIRAPRIALLRDRGPVCWDAAFYLEHNPDLPMGGVTNAAQAWEHYLGNGQFEGRASRCALQQSSIDLLNLLPEPTLYSFACCIGH